MPPPDARALNGQLYRCSFRRSSCIRPLKRSTKSSALACLVRCSTSQPCDFPAFSEQPLLVSSIPLSLDAMFVAQLLCTRLSLMFSQYPGYLFFAGSVFLYCFSPTLEYWLRSKAGHATGAGQRDPGVLSLMRRVCPRIGFERQFHFNRCSPPMQTHTKREFTAVRLGDFPNDRESHATPFDFISRA